MAAADMQLSTAALWLTVDLCSPSSCSGPALATAVSATRRSGSRRWCAISFGITIFWTVADLVGVASFTDEGLYLTDMARDRFGGEDGLGSRARARVYGDHAASKWTVLYRSDPPFVRAVFGVTSRRTSR